MSKTLLFFFSLTNDLVKVSCGNGTLSPRCKDCPRTNINVDSWCGGNCKFDRETETCQESTSNLSISIKKLFSR